MVRRLSFAFALLFISLFAQAQPQANLDLRPLTSAQFKTFPMLSSGNFADSIKHTEFMTDDQRENVRVVIVDGTIYDHDGKEFGTPNNNNNNQINYVMDAAGNFYLFDEFTHKKTRHSSIFHQGPVAGAGNITIVNSKITSIDLDSGHYFNGASSADRDDALAQVLKELKSRGVDTDKLGAKN